MKKPFIGILANLHLDKHEPLPYVEVSGVQRDYIYAIERAGGIPIMLPVCEEPEVIRQQVAHVDGILLTGGYDVHPLHYGEEPTPLLEATHPERDSYELFAIKIADELQKPIFAICRGMQLLNVAYGGSLYQDISMCSAEHVEHRQKAKRSEPTHTIEIVKETLLHKILSADSLVTNSFHHQAVKRLAPGFIVNAYSQDGMIEGIERPGERYMLALQWHPEMMAATDPYMQLIFQTFVNKCSNKEIDAR